MSFTLQKQVWSIQLEPNLKYCLQALADYAKDDGTGIFASVPTIAEKTGYVDRTVRRIIKKLVKLGYLILCGKKYKANLYAINLDKLSENPEPTPDKMSGINETVEDSTPDKMSPQSGQNVTLTPDKMSINPDKMSPKPIRTYPLNQSINKKDKKQSVKTDDGFSHRQKTDIIKAWYENLPAKPLDEKNPYVKKGYINHAQKILEAGYTVDQVACYVKAQCSGFWKDKKLPFGKVLSDMPLWLLKNRMQQTAPQLQPKPSNADPSNWRDLLEAKSS